MKLTIQVNEGPYQHQSADSAYFFAKAALEKGHEIFRIFFYHDGVNNGTRLTTPPQDDRNIVSRWTELARNMTLTWSCVWRQHSVAASLMTVKPKRNGKDATNIAPGFRISGLGQLVEGGIQSDRLVVFGD